MAEFDSFLWVNSNNSLCIYARLLKFLWGRFMFFSSLGCKNFSILMGLALSLTCILQSPLLNFLVCLLNLLMVFLHVERQFEFLVVNLSFLFMNFAFTCILDFSKFFHWYVSSLRNICILIYIILLSQITYGGYYLNKTTCHSSFLASYICLSQ
jgi:hypothetical protein